MFARSIWCFSSALHVVGRTSRWASHDSQLCAVFLSCSHRTVVRTREWSERLVLGWQFCFRGTAGRGSRRAGPGQWSRCLWPASGLWCTLCSRWLRWGLEEGCHQILGCLSSSVTRRTCDLDWTVFHRTLGSDAMRSASQTKMDSTLFSLFRIFHRRSKSFQVGVCSFKVPIRHRKLFSHPRRWCKGHGESMAWRILWDLQIYQLFRQFEPRLQSWSAFSSLSFLSWPFQINFLLFRCQFCLFWVHLTSLPTLLLHWVNEYLCL